MSKARIDLQRWLWTVGLVIFFSGTVEVAGLESASRWSKCSLKVRDDEFGNRRRPTVIGHRGASYNVPEHTLASYRLALELGADYLEPDLVATKDGVLVAVHSPDLNMTTNVASVYPSRFRQKSQDDPQLGFWVTDFSYAEILKLRVRQRVQDTPARTSLYDGLFPVPTLVEIMELLYDWNVNVRPVLGTMQQKAFGRPGLYVELKDPEWTTSDLRDRHGQNITMPDLFISTLRDNADLSFPLFFDGTECANLKFDEYQVPPLVLQCFHGPTLTYLRSSIQDILVPFFTTKYFSSPKDPAEAYINIPPLVLLAGKSICHEEGFWFKVTEMGLEGVGPDKKCLLGDKNTKISSSEATTELEQVLVDSRSRDFLRQAEEHELAIHPWTERLEVEFISDQFSTAYDELTYLFCDLHVHGMFAENVDLALRVASIPCDDSKTVDTTDSQSAPGYIKKYECLNLQSQHLVAMSLSTCAMGLFFGFFFTYWAMESYNKKREKRGRQLSTTPPPDDPVPVDDFEHDIGII